DVEAADLRHAFAGSEEACEQLHGGRFAGSVGAEEGGDLPARDREGDVSGGGKVAVELAEADGLDHGSAGLTLAHCLWPGSSRGAGTQGYFATQREAKRRKGLSY